MSERKGTRRDWTGHYMKGCDGPFSVLQVAFDAGTKGVTSVCNDDVVFDAESRCEVF